MKFTKLILTTSLFFIVLFFACKDKSEPAPTGCDAKTIVVSAVITPASSCSTNGKLDVSATGSTGFTFQLNSGAFQSGGVFSNLASGTYTITVKDLDGCTKSATYTVGDNSTKGPKFTAVAAVIASKCEGVFCHGTGSGGAPVKIMDTDCEIVGRGPTIKIKAVDEGMGSLSNTDKTKITAWITAGGKITD